MSRWNSCNVLQTAPDANRLWQFDAKGGGFVLNREHSGAPGATLPGLAAKSWSSLWQPKLNIAWLPPETVFLRVIELPKSTFDETLSMVELQLEKLSPIPVTQIVWTIHVLPQAAAEHLQTVVAVIAQRSAVEEFLGKIETQGYFADRLEAPMLDQLEATPATPASAALRRGEEDGLPRQSEAAAGAWIYPALLNGQSTALVAWWFGGALRSLSFIVLPPGGDRAKSLKEQFAQLTWAGEMEGWLTAQPKWHLVAGSGMAAEWENPLRESLGGPVQISQPLPPAELAARTARRAAAASPGGAALLPAEFSARYHQQFVDRLWLRGLVATGVLYAIGVAIYFCATYALAYRTHGLEQQVADMGGSYTNALQLKARYDVLKERQQLKYAALDCWKLVAENLPDGISLQRFSFGNGQTLALSGTATQDQTSLLTDHFYDPLRKAELNGQPMFDLSGGDQLTYRVSGNVVSWNFSLLLKHTDTGTP